MGLMNIMLFHSTYGLRPAVHAAAGRLRAAGHEVQVPDLFEGRTFETVEEGLAFKEEVGKDELLRRAVLAAAPYSDRGLVYAGFSFGASTAQTLALGDEKARGLLMFHGTSDIAENASVDELPVQLHVADPDPFETHDWLNSWYLQMQRAAPMSRSTATRVRAISSRTRNCPTSTRLRPSWPGRSRSASSPRYDAGRGPAPHGAPSDGPVGSAPVGGPAVAHPLHLARGELGHARIVGVVHEVVDRVDPGLVGAGVAPGRALVGGVFSAGVSET